MQVNKNEQRIGVFKWIPRYGNYGEGFGYVSSYLCSSTNATSWSYQTLGSSVLLVSIAWSGTQLVVVGAMEKGTGLGINSARFGILLSSPDGISWTQRYEDALQGTELSKVIWTGSKFIAVGRNGRCVSSTNGISWTPVFLPISTHLTGLVWTGAFIIATGENGGSFVSTDGINWTIAATPIISNSNEGIKQESLLWSGKSLVQLCASRGRYLYSTNTSIDGINWTLSPISIPSYSYLSIETLIFTGTQFIAYGRGSSTTDSLSYSLILTAPLDSTSTVSPLAKRTVGEFSVMSGSTGPSKFIAYTLGETVPVSLRFLDLRGRVVFTGINTTQGPGTYRFSFPEGSIAKGRYIQVFEAGSITKREMVSIIR